jgi:hypothetical protein
MSHEERCLVSSGAIDDSVAKVSSRLDRVCLMLWHPDKVFTPKMSFKWRHSSREMGAITRTRKIKVKKENVSEHRIGYTSCTRTRWKEPRSDRSFSFPSTLDLPEGMVALLKVKIWSIGCTDTVGYRPINDKSQRKKMKETQNKLSIFNEKRYQFRGVSRRRSEARRIERVLVPENTSDDRGVKDCVLGSQFEGSRLLLESGAWNLIHSI